MKVLTVNAFKCPMCKAIYKIAPLAASCLARCIKQEKADLRAAEKERALEVIRNSVRLEANSLTEAINLLVKNSKLYYKVDLKIDKYPSYFGIQSITHASPIGKRDNWGSDDKYPIGHLGWSGMWKGKIRGNYKTFFGDSDRGRPSFSDYLGRGHEKAFAGFHTGTGCGGSEFDIGGEIYLEDFPKIYAKEITKFEGNHLCCTVNPMRTCHFCDMKWCVDHATRMIHYVVGSTHRCPFDGYTLI